MARCSIASSPSHHRAIAIASTHHRLVGRRGSKMVRWRRDGCSYQFFVFRTDQTPRKKMAALVIGWYNIIFSSDGTNEREFNESWQEARSQIRPLPRLCFRADQLTFSNSFVADENKYSGVDIPENKFSVLTKFTRPPSLRIKWSRP